MKRIFPPNLSRGLLALGVAAFIRPGYGQTPFQSSLGDRSPAMSNVADPLHGKTTLLSQDDTGLLVQSNENFEPVFIPLNSENSNFQQQPSVNTGLLNQQPTNLSSVESYSASGRMFNNGNDVVMNLGKQFNGTGYQWAYSYWNPGDGKRLGSFFLNESTGPGSTSINTAKVVMGDFQGNNLQSALMFTESDFGSNVTWQMNVVAPVDPSQVDDIDPNGGGPMISGSVSPSQAPVSTSIVAGDFNQDGVAEIGVLLRDGQTILLYTINPKTLQIASWQTIKLPAALTNPTLAAGHFNTGSTVVLAAIGQQQGSQQITVDYIDPITNPQNPSVTIVTSTFSVPNLNSSVFVRAFAQAAPLYSVYLTTKPTETQPETNLEQLVMGLAYEYDSWHALLIGTFGKSYNFHLQEATGYEGCLLGMDVGNFNNLNSSGNINPNLQIALFKNFNSGSQCVPPFGDSPSLYVEMRNIAVPDAVANSPQAAPAAGATNWLDSLPRTELVPNLGNYNGLYSTPVFVTGDLQGRSERLGTPEEVSLIGHIQPNFVLGMPPMHVDWLQPFGGTGESCQTGSSIGGQPECTLNLDVAPNAVNANRSDAFSSTFSLTGSDSTTTSRQSTFSWGIGAKETVGIKAKFGVPDGYSGKAQLKTSIGNAYNSSTSEYSSQYSSKTEHLTTQTGFDDAVFFTAETQNFYNYPVLGKVDNNGDPVYATFSFPSQVQIGEAAGSTLDWYQPVHEPGNVLSYPWSSDALAAEFQPGTISQQANSGCLAVGSTSEAISVSWANRSGEETKSGWTDAVSENVNASASLSAGETILGEGVKITGFEETDISGSQAWGALNQSVDTATANQAVVLTTPTFDKTASSNFAYAFTNYVFGTAGSTPTYQAGSTLLPSGSDVTTTGPLFIGFTADPRTQCGEAGGKSFWTDAYNQPDVGFNHPDRWDVDTSNQASFNFAVTPSADNPLISQSFYRMKGLFITTGGPSNGSGGLGAGTVNSVPAGQSIWLTARVYNFSLVSTDQANAGSQVHVRFYGQKRCSGIYGDKQVVDLCPNQAFQIRGSGRDGDVVIGSISGFHDSTGAANWGLASVNFDTTGFDDSEVVFWAVTWIEDANGNVIGETPDHGVKLASFVGKQFNNITDIPVQAHSNNVGFYAANHPFYVAKALPPPTEPEAAHARVETTPKQGALRSIDLSLKSRNFRVDKVTHFIAKFTAGDFFPGSTVLYFDGDPSHGGKLFDIQAIHSIQPDGSTEHLVNYRAERCGPHTIYAISEPEGLPKTTGIITANVMINPAKEVATMTTYVKELHLEPYLEQPLLSNLSFAQKRFEDGNVESGLASLKVFADLVRLIPLRNDNRLLMQTNVLLGNVKLIRSCEAQQGTSRQTAPSLIAARN